MIDANRAIRNAAEFLRDSQSSLGNAPTSLRVEEVRRDWVVNHQYTDRERSNDSWMVTLSYFSSDDDAGVAALTGEGERLYRMFQVLVEDGEVVSMEVPEWLRPQLKAG